MTRPSRSLLAQLSPADLDRLAQRLEHQVEDLERGKVPWRCSVENCDGKPHPGRMGAHARAGQLPPEGDDWDVWMALAGRGFGKTRMGAEWALEEARVPGTRGALVGPTAADTRDILVEGESGILACAPATFRPVYEPSKRRLTYPNGSIQICYSADEPDRLRGPQHHYGWFDELAAWRRLQYAWDMAQMGMRLGEHPRICITTTPRPLPLIKELLKDERCVTVRGSTYDNLHNLADTFQRAVLAKYEGTTLGRQELYADVLDDLPGAMVARYLINEGRVEKSAVPAMRVINIGMDPAGTGTGDETGLVVVGRGVDGRDYVLDDRSDRLTPDKACKRAYAALEDWDAQFIIVEDNNGKDWIEATLRNVWRFELRKDSVPPIRRVNASQGKRLRAQPVAARYEQRRVSHAGEFPELEDQMTTWIPEEDPHDSPDRLDALVHVIAHHMKMYDRGEVKVAAPRGVASRATGGVHPLEAARRRRAAKQQEAS